jgi:hypothetical protein
MHDALEGPFENLDRLLHLVALGLGSGVELVGRHDLSLPSRMGARAKPMGVRKMASPCSAALSRRADRQSLSSIYGV